MKTSLSAFTRGSRLLGHFLHMFGAGVRFPVWASVICLCLWLAWRLHQELTLQDHYLVLMRLEALAWGWMEFNPANAVALETVDGTRVQMTWGTVLDWPPIAEASERWTDAAKRAIGRAAVALI